MGRNRAGWVALVIVLLAPIPVIATSPTVQARYQLWRLDRLAGEERATRRKELFLEEKDVLAEMFPELVQRVFQDELCFDVQLRNDGEIILLASRREGDTEYRIDRVIWGRVTEPTALITPLASTTVIELGGPRNHILVAGYRGRSDTSGGPAWIVGIRFLASIPDGDVGDRTLTAIDHVLLQANPR